MWCGAPAATTRANLDTENTTNSHPNPELSEVSLSPVSPSSGAPAGHSGGARTSSGNSGDTVLTRVWAFLALAEANSRLRVRSVQASLRTAHHVTSYELLAKSWPAVGGGRGMPSARYNAMAFSTISHCSASASFSSGT